MTATNTALGNRYLDIMRTQDLGIADEIYGPGFVCHFGSLPPLDVASWKEVVQVWLTAFPDLKPTDEVVIADADRVAVQMHWTATHQGEFMGVPATGKTVTGQGVSTFRVADGKLVEEWIFEDVVGLLQQLGALPSA